MSIALPKLLRNSWDRADYEHLLRLIGHKARTLVGDVSRSEAAAYIAFLAEGKTRQDWEELGSEEQVKMVLSSVEVTSLVGPSQQRIWILEDFLMDDMVNEPKWENLPEGIGLWIEGCFKVKAPMAIHMEECALQTIEQTLLHPYPKLPIKLKRKCNIGHIFHGIVELCQYHCPHPWTDHCCVLDPTDEVVQLQKEQQKAHLFLAVVSSQTHWALLAASKNDVDASGVAQAVVYDGDFLDVIQKGCEEWLARVEAQQGLTFKLTMAEVPKQEDTWSCGHRCLLAANRVLSALFEYREPLPKKFDESFASDADLKALCSNVLVRPPVPPKLETKSEPLKHERLALPGHVIVKRQKPDDEVAAVAQQMSHSKPGHSAGSHECDPARGPTASSSNGQRDDAGDARMADAGDARMADARMADAADVAPAPSTPPARKRALPEDESPVGKQEKKKAKKLSKKDLAQKVKSLQEELLGKGLEHNGSWQKAHAQIKALPARGHWQKFFETLVAGEEASFECEACKRLAAVYMPGEPEEQLEEEQEKKDAGFRKRGRPTRDARQTDVLRKYLAAHRSGIYQPVKPDHGAEGDEEAQDAKRFHYFCVPCQKVVQFFREAVTYVHLHESQSAGHAKGLKALGLMKDGTAAGERTACNGVRVNQVSGRLSELTCSLRLWLSAGQPCALGVGAKKALLEVGSWRQQDDAFIVRHNDCCGAQSSLGCHDCLTFAENPKVAQEIASWGYKLDLITLAYNIAYGSSEDVKNHVLLMKTRDYMVTQLAGSDLDDILKLAPRGRKGVCRGGV